MKKLKTLLLIAVIAVSFNSIQTQSKVAHIDFQAMVELMPETKAMMTELEKLGKTYQDEIKKAQDDLVAKAAKYEKEASLQTPAENQKRQLEVQTDDQKLRAAQQGAQQALGQKRNELLEPIIKKMTDAIKEVAKEQDFSYVLDKSSLIVAEGTDLTSFVKTKLNITE